MYINFLIKDLFKRRKIIFLLIIQVIVYSYFLINFFSINMFEKDYIKNYFNNFPIANGAFIKDMKRLSEIQNEHEKTLKFFKYLDNNKNIKQYKLYMYDELLAKNFNIDNSQYTQRYLYDSYMRKQYIPYYKIDYNYYLQIKEYVKGVGFNIKDFNGNYKTIPLIMGRRFAKKYKIGDILASENDKIKFKVVGFLEKDILFFDGDPIENSNSSEGSFIIPLNREEFNKPHKLGLSLRNIIIEFKENVNYKKAVEEFEYISNKMGLNITLSNFNNPLKNFLKLIEGQAKFELVRIAIFTVVCLGIFTLSTIHSINLRKKELGILYAVGATKRHIIIFIFFDIIVVMILGYLISLPLYIYNSELIICSFVNNFSIRNFILALCCLIINGIISLIIVCNKIIKSEPRDLIGGFRE